MMDARLVDPCIAAVEAVFKTMVAADITAGQPFAVGSSREPSADVSAMVGLSGDAVGCVVLSLPMDTAIRVAGKFAGVEMTRYHPDLADALGELANMIAGQAKARFEGLQILVSLPSVIIGKEHSVSHLRQAPRVALPFYSALGEFWVEAAMVFEKQPQAITQTPAAAGAGA